MLFSSCEQLLFQFGDQGYSLPQFCFFRHYESETEPYSLQMLSDEAEFLSGDVIEVILRGKMIF